ncbi:MAG: bifunctional DNA primase/polymerase [Planctomycetes bacterium]|nr:bifunctional DNA primase/polymerase [Planctomycetota bacterium]
MLHEVQPDGSCSCKNRNQTCPAPNGKDSTAKHPRLKEWSKDLITDERAATTAWGRYPNANVGLCPREDQIVLDVDPRNGGDATIGKLIDEFGDLTGPCALTGGGGRHYWLKLRSGIDIAIATPRINRSLKALGPGIDLRTCKNQVVAPPSMHKSGHRYEWVQGRSILACEPVVPSQEWQRAIGLIGNLEDILSEARSGDWSADDLERAEWGLLQQRLLDPDRGYDEWLRIGAALKALGDAGLRLWIEASRPSKDFDEAEIRRKWPGLTGSSINSLFGMFDDADATWRSRFQQQRARPDVGSSSTSAGSAQGAAPESDKCARRPLSIADVLGQWRVDGPLIHVPTGIAKLDEMTGGGPTFGCRVYVLGAPDAGKTQFLVQVADVYQQAGVVVGILAIDEEPGDVTQRLLQRRGFTRRACELRDNVVLDSMRAATGPLDELRIYDSDWTIEAAATDLATYAKSIGARAALLVDSVQTARSAAESGKDARYDVVTARVAALRVAATQHRMIVIATSEMNRGAYRSVLAAERTDDMAAAKESGAIEYSARVMISLRSVQGESDLIEMRVVKNKLGPRTPSDEAGAYLRIDRPQQTLTEANDYTAPPQDDAGARAKAAKNESRILRDAALLAVIISKQPGVSATRCKELFTAQPGGGAGDSRFRAGRGRLGSALVDILGAANSKLLYIDGGAVPPDVVNAIPIADRPVVAASVRPAAPRPSNPPEQPSHPESPRVTPSHPGATAASPAESVCAHTPIGVRTHTDSHTHCEQSKPRSPRKRSRGDSIDDGMPEQPGSARRRRRKTGAS